MGKQVGVVAASVIQSSSHSYATSSIVDAKPSRFQSWLFGEPKSKPDGDTVFPEVKDDSLEGDDGDMSQDDAPEIVLEPKKPIILPPGSLAKSVMRVFKAPMLILAVPIVFAFKDMEETSVAKTYAFAEILTTSVAKTKALAETLETSVVKTKAAETVEQTQPVAQTTPPKKSFWDMLKNALGVIGAAFTAAGGIVAYYAFPSTRLPDAE
jgi:hypothetical protein